MGTAPVFLRKIIPSEICARGAGGETPIPLYGDGSTRARGWLHVDDHSEAMVDRLLTALSPTHRRCTTCRVRRCGENRICCRSILLRSGLQATTQVEFVEDGGGMIGAMRFRERGIRSKFGGGKPRPKGMGRPKLPRIVEYEARTRRKRAFAPRRHCIAACAGCRFLQLKKPLRTDFPALVPPPSTVCFRRWPRISRVSGGDSLYSRL